MAIVTIRRIRLNVVNLGVWMIHVGVIVLALGSIYYFTTKVEGDTPVIRRNIVVTLDDGRSATLPSVRTTTRRSPRRKLRLIGTN